MRSPSALSFVLALSVLSVLLALPTPTSARIGETRDACARRYGPLLEESSPQKSFYAKGEYLIIITWINGRAGTVGITRIDSKPITTSEMDLILSANSDGKPWTLAQTSPMRWTGKDGRVAGYNNSTKLISLMSADYIESLKNKSTESLSGF